MDKSEASSTPKSRKSIFGGLKNYFKQEVKERSQSSFEAAMIGGDTDMTGDKELLKGLKERASSAIIEEKSEEELPNEEEKKLNESAIIVEKDLW